MQAKEPQLAARVTGYLAVAAGVIGVATAVALGLMYGIELSRPGPRVFGPASDIGGGLFNVLAAAVFIRLHHGYSGSRRAGIGLAIVVVLLLGGAVASFLLVAKVLDFVPATAAAILALAALTLWLMALCLRMRSSGNIPPRLGGIGALLGACFPAGCVIVALGLLVPAGWMQWVVFGIGGLVGLTAWVGIPVWFVLFGRHLLARQEAGAPLAPWQGGPQAA